MQFPTPLPTPLEQIKSKQISTCSFCNRIIPKNRRNSCSVICIKRRYAMKHCVTSRFKNDSNYWNTQTGKGVKWEKWFIEKFGGIWMNEEIMGQFYDVDWNGKKIDIKASEFYCPLGKSGQWTFVPTSIKLEIDYYACIALLKDIPMKCLLIPADLFHLRKGITIGKKSQFDIYNIL